MKNIYIFNTWNFILLFVPLFFCFVSSVYAVDVSFVWDPNSEPDLAAYRVYSREEGKSYDYSTPAWKGTTTYCTIYNLDETKNYYFISRAFDTQGLESDDSSELYLESRPETANQPPIANAGPDQIIDKGQLVNLNGSNSTDPDDGIASYQWVQTNGPQVNLSDPNGQQLTFTAPNVGTKGASLIFELTVIDHSGLKNKDTCVVNVTRANEKPEANAGSDQVMDEGAVVILDGSSSFDIDDGIVSYLWTQIGDPTVTLSNPASSTPTFTAPNVGPNGASLTFNLTVTDAGGLQDSDSCIVNISWQNKSPTAVVTPDYMEVIKGTLVRLDGTASTDSDDGIFSYLWNQVDGDPVSLSDPTSAITTFTAPETDQHGKNLKFKLTVKDFGGLQDTADSSIYIRPKEFPNNPPAVNFGYETSRKRVTFTDRSTDSDGTIVSWFWDFGDDKNSTEQNPGHRYRKIGNYTVTLTVTDDGGASNSISKNLTVTK